MLLHFLVPTFLLIDHVLAHVLIYTICIKIYRKLVQLIPLVAGLLIFTRFIHCLSGSGQNSKN